MDQHERAFSPLPTGPAPWVINFQRHPCDYVFDRRADINVRMADFAFHVTQRQAEEVTRGPVRGSEEPWFFSSKTRPAEWPCL